jgi:nucleoside-diphosphate-sugar epimerase
MKAFITGASGFIGSELVRHLDGDITAIPHDHIAESKLTPFDYFYFCSAYGNLYTQTDPELIYKANIADVFSFINQARDLRFKSFVYLSTSSVRLRTQSMYSRSKKAAEEILLSFMEKYDLPISIIRPFTVIGPKEPKGHLIPVLIDAAFTGKQVNLAASPTHDFIDVKDVASGIKSLAEHGARGIFELGTGRKHTNLEVFQMVEAITGKRIKVNFVDSMRPYDNYEWVSTNFKSRSFGWLPEVSLHDSITEMVDAYKEEHDVA